MTKVEFLEKKKVKKKGPEPLKEKMDLDGEPAVPATSDDSTDVQAMATSDAEKEKEPKSAPMQAFFKR